jgi:hypothetical protein
MPRRGFFGGGGRDKKSSSKKQLKLSQQYVQDSLRQQLPQQQQQQRRPSNTDIARSLGSQTSFSQDTYDLSPNQIGSPTTQTAPTHTKSSHAYAQHASDMNYQRISNSGIPQPGSGNIDGEMMIHQHGKLQQYQVHPNVLHQPLQGYEEHSHQHHYQTNPLHHEHVHDTLPCNKSQPQPLSTAPHQHHYQQMTPQHYNVIHHPTPQGLSVANATDEIWRCATDDFRSASHAIQMLRLAIVAEWESQRMLNEESLPKVSNGWSYDPSEIFLRLQGVALRFHSTFKAMQAEKAGELENHVSGYVGGEKEGIEWELTEQAAWEVWEESIRATAALAHACVGPAWYRQIQMRKQLLKESEMRLMYHSYIQQQRSLLCDNRSDTSSVGGASMSSTIASTDMSTGHSIGTMSGAWPTINPPTDMLQMISHPIPEVLPAAMIRFATLSIEAIPPLRTKESKIFWNPKKKNDVEFLLNSLGQHIREERRWLRRRRRLGDTQRFVFI